MDSKRLDELLKKYWECETSLEEEQQLRSYFNRNDVPDELASTANLFRYFEAQKSGTLSDDFDSSVLKSVKEFAPRPGRTRTLVSYSLRIAAGVVVLVMAIFLVRQELRKPEPVAVTGELVDTYDDPQKAFEETKKALQMISKGFGRAEQQARKINAFNEAQEKIQTQLKKGTGTINHLN
ncbi:hypothetical protein QQ054_29600 [Oscillatoria amoena NRMC-F 0135]|nr:hypothetical protein [Oscillatoria amoena NRMC-F 0135]